MKSLKRTKRQIEAVNKWITNNKKGTLEFATGVGKTNTAIIAVKKLRKIDLIWEVHIVVPTLYLKQQWEKEIEREGLNYLVSVYVLNTYVKQERECDLLIIDEIHNIGSPKRIKILGFRYRYILGLTATIKRKDHKHKIILSYAPIVDKIDLDEAREENYVSDYIVYNLGIELSELDRLHLNDLNKQFYTHFSYFGRNFDLAMKCMSDKIARKRYSESTGFKEEQIAFHAVRFNYYMQKRKNFLYNLPSKLILTKSLTSKLNVKTITFSENIQTTDELTYVIEDSLSYHSKLKKKQREENLQRFKDNEIHVLNTSKALDEGFDVGDIELIIITSSRAVNRVDVQRTGRAIRFRPNKLAVIVNIYVKNSKDEDWLRERQEKSNNIYWVDHVDQIKFERPKIEACQSYGYGSNRSTFN